MVNGGVQCWGYGNYGALGNNTTTYNQNSPVQAIPSGSNVTAITVESGGGEVLGGGGEPTVCAIVNGSPQCWGFGFYGSIGNNTNWNAWTPTQVYRL